MSISTPGRMAIDIYQLRGVVFVDVVIGGQKKQKFKKIIGRELARYEMRPMADEVKKLISRNLRLSREYTGGKAAALSPEWVAEKTRKKRSNPKRVFYDKGMLVNGLRIRPTTRGYEVAFKPYTYPETKTTMNNVAFYLHTGGGKLPARPFFGLTDTHFKQVVSNANIRLGVERAVKSQARRVAKFKTLPISESLLMGEVQAIDLKLVFKDTEQKNSSDRYPN